MRDESRMRGVAAFVWAAIIAVVAEKGLSLRRNAHLAPLWRGNGVRSHLKELGGNTLRRWEDGELITDTQRRSVRGTALYAFVPLKTLPATTLVTALTPWYQDDLPNILGINPLEAAVIFGALYYFYGPTTLYKYTREAGVFFSTYAPIVKDVVTDIFDEFRDYLDEDREREDLKNAGVDVDNIPRRTTNIIERFQESLDTFSEMSSSLDGSGSVGVGVADDESDDELSSVIDSSATNLLQDDDSGYGVIKPEVSAVTRKDLVREKEVITSEGGKPVKKNMRKSKKEIFDAQMTTEQSTIFDESEYQDEMDRSLAESVNTIKDQFDSLQQQSAANAAEAAAMTAGTGTENNMMAQQMQVQAMMAAKRAQEVEQEESSANSRFAAQLSGDWNAKVLSDPSVSAPSSSPFGEEMMPSSTIDDPPQTTFDEYGWPDMSTTAPYDDENFGPINAAADSSSSISEIPDMVSGGDAIPVSDSLLFSEESDACDDEDEDSASSQAAMDMLKELDRDYQSLRHRLVTFIESQDEQTRKQAAPLESMTPSLSASEVPKSQMSGTQSKQYWPPAKPRDY